MELASMSELVTLKTIRDLTVSTLLTLANFSSLTCCLGKRHQWRSCHQLYRKATCQRQKNKVCQVHEMRWYTYCGDWLRYINYVLFRYLFRTCRFKLYWVGQAERPANADNSYHEWGFATLRQSSSQQSTEIALFAFIHNFQRPAAIGKDIRLRDDEFYLKNAVEFKLQTTVLWYSSNYV